MSAAAQLDQVGRRTWVSQVVGWARTRPDHPAVVAEGGESVSFGAMLAHAADAAAALARHHGVQGDHGVALHLDNGTAYATLILAVGGMGCAVVPISTKLTPPEIARVLALTGVHVLVTGADADEARDLQRALPGAEVVPATALLPARPNLGRTQVQPAILEAFVRSSSALDQDQPCTMICTSGSTAAPVPIVLSHGNIAFTGACLRTYYGFGPSDVGWTVFPWAHANGHMNHLLTWLSAGMTVVTTPFSASRFCEQLSRHRPTVMSLNATHIKMVLAQLPAEVDRVPNTLRMLKTALGLDRESQERFGRIFGVRFYKSYGQTECVAPVTLVNPDEFRWAINANPIGFAAPPYVLRLVDDDGVDVAPGEIGEILVHPVTRHGISLGHIEGDRGMVLHNRDGWWSTGDLAQADEDGFLYYAGRTRDMIKRAGHNVSAAEVEEVILCHPAVRDAAVIGLADPMREESIVAVVQLGSAELSLDELRRHCAASLAAYKLPDQLIIVDAVPRTEIGKLDKKALRSRLEQPAAANAPG